jgi:predicted dehydrogenase
MPRPLGIGMVGYGQMGRLHTHALRSLSLYYEPCPADVRLVGVCDANAARAEAGRTQGGYAFACTDPAKLIERKDIDVLCVCTPNKMHFPVVKAAVEAGKHVFCEKPLGFDVKESEALAALARKGKGTYAVNSEFRCVNAVMTAKRFVEEGRIGRLFHFRGAHLHAGYVDPKRPREWRFVKAIIGGGVLTDLGPHILDLMMHLCGPVDEVCCQMETFFKERPLPEDPAKTGPVDVEDAAMLLVRFRNGGLGTVETSRVSTGHEDEFRLEAHGSAGALAWRSMDPSWLRVYNVKDAKGEQGFKQIGTVQKYPPPAVMPAGKFSAGFERFLVHAQYCFVRAVAEGAPQVLPTFDESLAMHRVIDAAYRSAETRGWVKVQQ